jgi:DNA-directed RNA polymerase specialized sigma24 family protein
MYLAHADNAIKLAYLLTGDRALAEDLVQDAFVKMAGRLRHLRDPGAFEAYLRRTVVNLSRMHYRHAGVERAYLERQPTPDPVADPDVPVESPPGGGARGPTVTLTKPTLLAVTSDR